MNNFNFINNLLRIHDFYDIICIIRKVVKAMYLKKTPNKSGRIFLSIVDSYYDKATKNSKHKTIESLGYLDELEKQYSDPIAHFSKRVEQLKEEKKAKQAPISFTFYDSDQLYLGCNLRKNFGYAVLSKIYHELGINKFLINRQRHSKEEYDANTIMKMLVYSRLLAPTSKKYFFDKREIFFEKTDYSLEDIYGCLAFLNKHKESLQIWMNDKIKKDYKRDTSLIYYYVTNYYFEAESQNNFTCNSKEQKLNTIMQLGIFIDNNGIPITYKLFSNNMNDCRPNRPNFEKIKKEFKLDKIITINDKGMTTGDNNSLWQIEEYFKITKSGMESKPVFVWTQEHIEAHFFICFIALTIARVLEIKLTRKYSIEKLLNSLANAQCSQLQRNYYIFDYFDEVLKDIGSTFNIDFSKRIRTLGEIKKILADTKK